MAAHTAKRIYELQAFPDPEDPERLKLPLVLEDEDEEAPPVRDFSKELS